MPQKRIAIEIDDKLKQKVLIKAVFERKTIKQVVTTLLKEWLKKEPR